MSSIFGSKPGSSVFDNTASSGQSQPAQTSTLFSNLGSPQPTSGAGGGSVFGNATSNQPQQPAPLFSNLGQQQTKPNPFPGIFSTSQPQQPAAGGGSSLFGTAAPTTSQPVQTPSLFTAPNNASTAQPATSSLFAPQQQPQEQQQNQPNQAGQGEPQQGSVAGKNANPVHFDSLLEKGRKRARDVGGETSFQELPNLQLGLGDIAKRVRELGAAGSQSGGKGAGNQAHYLLAASGVNAGATRRDLDSLAARPLRAENIKKTIDWDPDSHKYVEQLQQQSTLKMIQEGLERAQKNFDAYLEENVDINWDLQRKKIYDHFGLTPRDSDADEESGKNVKGSFGHSTRKSRLGKCGRPGNSTLNRSIFGQSSLQKSVIGTPGVGTGNATLFADVAEKSSTAPAGVDDRYLRERQRKYAEKVQSLNHDRLRKARLRSTRTQEASYPVLQQFSSIESQPGGDSPKQISDAYKALIEIVGEGSAKERQFADEYLDETPNSAKGLKARKMIIDGSRRSLEKAFLEQLENLVARNPREANIGGVPTAINKIRAYIRIRAARKDLAPDGLGLAVMGSDFPWALIFFLLRTGLVNEAAGYVVDNAAYIKTLDRNIITFITAFAKSPDRRLEGRLQRECNNVFAAITKTAPGDSIDPYRIASYKIIGRCELSKRSIDHVGQGVEDWIWLQFNLAREVNRVEESAGEVFGLDEVRETIREIGQRHFAKGAEGLGGYGTFFHLLILGGMFEQAVSYLYSYSYVTAVHFAIGLDYYGLLRVSDFSVTDSELLTHNTKELPQISFGRMLGYYTRDFRAGNVEAAVDYLALICLNADLPGAIGKSQASLCHEALREVVLETREFARLLGDIRYDGTRLKGAIEERLEIIGLADQEDFLKTVTVQAASIANDNGRTTDAVLLYHLAEDYDNVITIINRALSEAITVDIGAEPVKLQPLKPRTAGQQDQSQPLPQPEGGSLSLTSVDNPFVLAKNMMSLYNNNTMYYQKIRSINRESCGVLLRIGDAKDQMAAERWSDAFDIIHSLRLLPLDANASIPAIRASATAFNSLPGNISRNIGPLLLWTITCIGRQREQLAAKQFGADAGPTKQLSEALLGNARDLMVFAGLIKYRLGERIWEAVCGVGGDMGVY